MVGVRWVRGIDQETIHGTLRHEHEQKGDGLVPQRYACCRLFAVRGLAGRVCVL